MEHAHHPPPPPYTPSPYQPPVEHSSLSIYHQHLTYQASHHYHHNHHQQPSIIPATEGGWVICNCTVDSSASLPSPISPPVEHPIFGSEERDTEIRRRRIRRRTTGGIASLIILLILIAIAYFIIKHSMHSSSSYKD